MIKRAAVAAKTGLDEKRRRRRLVLLLVFVGIIVALIWVFRAVLAPFLVALFTAYLIDPLIERMAPVRLFGRFRLGRGGAIVAIYLVLIAGLYLAGVFALPALGGQIRQARQDLPVLRQSAESRLQEVDQWLSDFTGRTKKKGEGAHGEGDEGSKEGDEASKGDQASKGDEEAGDGTPVAVPPPRKDTEFRGGRVVARDGRFVVLRMEEGFEIVDLDEPPPEDPPPAEDGASGDDPPPAPPPPPPDRGRVRLHYEGGGEVAGNVVSRTEEEIVLRGFGETHRIVPVDDVEWEEVLETGEEAVDVSKFVQRMIERAESSLDQVLGYAIRFVIALVGTLYQLVLILMITAFLVIDRPGIVRFLESVPPEQHKPLYQRLMEYFDRGLAGVIRGQLLICLVNGILTWIGLQLLGVRYALLLGFVAGVFSLIPIFGTILSTIPIVVIAWGTSGIQQAVLALGWILLIHFVEANFLNPKIMGTASKIHPVVVIFALLAGEHAYGIVGALLAVPTASLVQSAFKFFVLDRQTEKFETDDAAPEPA